MYILSMLERGKSLEEVRKRLAEWDAKLGRWRETLDEQGSRTEPPDPIW